MKILQVIPYFYPAWAYGGSPKNTYELCKSLVKRGHEVTVYTTDLLDANHRLKTSSQKNPSIVDGIKVHYYKNASNWLAWKHQLSFAPSSIKAIRDNIENFDVVHLQAYRTFYNIMVAHYARKYNIPYILQARGSLPRIMAKQKLKGIFDTIWGYNLLRDASNLIAVSQMEVKAYTNMGVNPNKIKVIPNGINTSEFDNLPERGRFRKAYNLNDRDKLILFLGRIHKVKGIDLLLKASAKILKTCDEVKLVIAGPDDGFLSEVKKLTKELNIEDKVLLTGPLYGKDKVEAYVDADVYVLPSSYEIFGLTILEACACGTPVIATDQCGLSKTIDNQIGFIVPYDSEQLEIAISHMLHDEKKRQEFSKCAKLLVRRQFLWHKIAKQVEGIYISAQGNASLH